jgi:hypothetical protein
MGGEEVFWLPILLRKFLTAILEKYRKKFVLYLEFGEIHV